MPCSRNEIPEALECFQEILTAAESETYDALAIANAAITTAGALMVQGHFNQAEPLAGADTRLARQCRSIGFGSAVSPLQMRHVPHAATRIRRSRK